MQINKKDNSIIASAENEEIGRIDYEIDGNTLNILHTEVDEAKQGQGIGSELVDAVAAFAREEKLYVKPYCSFAKNTMMANAEKYSDILH